MKSTIAMEVTEVLSEVGKSTRFCFTGNKEIGIEQNSVLGSEMTCWYAFTSLLCSAIKS